MKFTKWYGSIFTNFCQLFAKRVVSEGDCISFDSFDPNLYQTYESASHFYNYIDGCTDSTWDDKNYIRNNIRRFFTYS